MKKITAFLLIAISLFSCTGKNENQQRIIGSWAGVDWQVEGRPSGHNASETFFTFDDKGIYKFEYTGTTEKGRYKVENNMLFTTPENQTEIMVKIAKLTADTLIFDMNRSGVPELLTLIRKR